MRVQTYRDLKSPSSGTRRCVRGNRILTLQRNVISSSLSVEMSGRIWGIPALAEKDNALTRNVGIP